MKNLILSLFVFFAINLTLEAQRPQGAKLTPEEKAQKRTERMTEKLGLDKDQITKVKEINLKIAKIKHEQRKNASGDKTAMREAMQKIRIENNEELKLVLTEEQFEKFLTHEEEMKKRKGQKNRQGRGQF